MLLESNSKHSKKRAFTQFGRASEQGNIRAHYFLGKMHRENLVADTNPKAAFHHFSVASGGGDKDSKYELALCNLEGYGTDKKVPIGLQM